MSAMGGFGTPGHRKRHQVNSTKDHLPIPGDHDENAIVVMDANGLPVKDSGVPLSTIVNGLTPKGDWDASGGTYPTPGKIGDFWWITVAGTIGGVDYQIHDWLVFISWGTPPPESAPAVWKKIDNTDRAIYENAAQWYWVSQAKGSDTTGDGSLFNPFATAQKAINAGVLAGMTMIDIVLDQTVVSQAVTIPAAKIVSFEALAGPESPPYFTSITLSPGCFCNCNSITVDSIVEDGAAGLRWIWFEEGYLQNPFTMPNTEVRFSVTRVPTASLNASTAALISGHVYLSDWSYRFMQGIGVNNNLITNVANPISPQDAVNLQYAETEITLSGATPVNADMLAQPFKKQAVGVGTGGRIFFMTNRGTPTIPIVKSVEMS
jgi:hypothetical protein